MNSKIPRFLFYGLVVTAIGSLFIPKPEKSAAGVPTTLYLDLDTGPGAPGAEVLGGLPPNGSSWHELHPAFCSTHVQDDYEDNGNGIVDACDFITLSGIRYHITWAGPTYYTTSSPTPGGPPTGEHVFEPTGPPNPGNPICQIWHEVWPNFCREMHIDSFHDTDGSGSLTVCDYVDVQGQSPTEPPVIFYHIDRIGLDITIEPVPNTPTKQSTWGKIKSLLGF